MHFEIEGPDAAGKTTLFNQLMEYEFFTVESHALDSHSDAIQKWFCDVDYDPAKFFLYLAEGVHLDRIYRREIKKNPRKHLLLDRGVYSMLAYTAAMSFSEKQREFYGEILRSYLKLVTLPDVVLYVHVPPEESERRLNRKGSRAGKYEKQAQGKKTFWKKIDQSYRWWFREMNQRGVYLDGTLPRKKLFELALAKIRSVK